MKMIAVKSAVVGALLALVVLGGCDLASRDFYRSDSPVPDEGKGALVLVLDGSEIPTRTLAPDPDVYGPMSIFRYDISGIAFVGQSGDLIPSGDSFPTEQVIESELPGGVYTKTDLSPAWWVITVVAYNDQDTRIGSVTSDPFEVWLNKISTVVVEVLPDTGDGTLSLKIQWPDGSVLDPRVDARLTRVDSGTYVDIGSASVSTPRFTIDTAADPERATYYVDPVTGHAHPAGYYTLHLALLGTDNDSGNPYTVLGDVVSVRIVYDQLTEGLWDLTSTGGTAKVTIDSDLQNPIGVSLSDTDNLDGTFTVLAQLTPDSDNTANSFSYAWYIDGAQEPVQESAAPIGILSDTYDLNPGPAGLALASGTHNLSVVVTAYKDGTTFHSVSSATHSFTVQ